MELVLASANSGKQREFEALLAPLGFQIRSQAAFGIREIDETGATFVENALLKARHACAFAKLPALADDSGIAVDALGGAPGLHSARYAGYGADDQANLKKLLQALRDTHSDNRVARYHCVLVYMRNEHDQSPIICHAQWEGRITREPRGANGFGYDPVFYVPTHDCTAAELAPEAKNKLSHRGQALAELVAKLKASGIGNGA